MLDASGNCQGPARHPARGSRIPFVITVDVEPDDVWTDHLRGGLKNIATLLRLQRLLDEFGARATLLVTYRVLKDSRCAALLRRLANESGAEIGAHLHPWENPPFLPGATDRRYPAFPHELPPALFRAKLERLTDELTRRFGTPTAYRAGRWGLAAAHLPVLEGLGYQVDSSVVPLANRTGQWGIPRAQGGLGGPDYRRAPTAPYHPDYDDARRPGSSRILEWPVSVEFTRPLPGLLRRCYAVLPALSQRVLHRAWARPVWCKPVYHSERQLCQLLRAALARPRAHVNMVFHSSELAVGGAPRTRTTAQVEAVFRRIAAILELAARSGRCEFTTLTRAARTWSVGPERAAESADLAHVSLAPGRVP